MKQYQLKINPNFALDNKNLDFKFKSKEELLDYLTKTLSYEKDEVNELVEKGGKFEGIKETEFEIIIHQPEQTHFNNSELFVKDFSDYLIGKTTKIKGKNHVIKNVESEKEKVKITDDLGSYYLPDSSLKEFIDGEMIEGEIYLILQEEKFNNSEYKYYITKTIDGKLKIIKGFEYKEDAKSILDNLHQFGDKDPAIVTKKDLQSVSINPDDNENWVPEIRDWEIIKEALKAGVSRKDFNEKRAQEYFDEHETNGKWLNVIKAQLIFLLEREQKRLRSSFINSDAPRIIEQFILIKRIENELLNALKLEK